jgi:hypothetical protein
MSSRSLPRSTSWPVRIPVDDFLAPGTAPCAVDHSNTFSLSLDPWLSPGDDLKRLHFTSVLGHSHGWAQRN